MQAKDMVALMSSLEAWEFPKDDGVFEEAMTCMDEFSAQLRVVSEAVEAEPKNGPQCEAALAQMTWHNEEMDVECTRRMRQLQSIAHANCAACNLALKNYGLVKRDCRHALEFDGGNLKACYRLAKVGGSASAASRGVTNLTSVPGKPCAEAV